MTNERIEQFRRESARAGDRVAAAVCVLALGGDQSAVDKLGLDEVERQTLEDLDLGSGQHGTLVEAARVCVACMLAERRKPSSDEKNAIRLRMIFHNELAVQRVLRDSEGDGLLASELVICVLDPRDDQPASILRALKYPAQEISDAIAKAEAKNEIPTVIVALPVDGVSRALARTMPGSGLDQAVLAEPEPGNVRVACFARRGVLCMSIPARPEASNPAGTA